MAAATPVKPRPYRRILTSTLHRRFVHASAFALLACYIISFLIGAKTSFFWSWFPLGSCGIRALLLFISSLCVFVLRVGQMHVGARTTDSHFQTFTQTAFSFDALQTFSWYIFSSWWFSEVYKWSSSESAELNWVKPGKPYERSQLNERPIYLHCFFILLALVQSTFHLAFDWDEVAIPVVKRSPQSTSRNTHPLDPFATRFSKSLPRILYEAGFISLSTAIAGPFIYMIVLRKIAWSWTLSFAKLFWNFPRSAADPPGVIPPLHISLLLRSAIAGILLVGLWQVSNFLFSAFLGQAPIKKGQPLTNATKDPNGSLINGLKAKKGTVVTFALWELCLISQDFPDRRKEIFKDIDREAGTGAWSQILTASEGVIKGITSRIQDFQNPQQKTAPQSSNPPSSESSQQQGPVMTDTQAMVQTLPRIAPPAKSENILLASPKPSTRSEKFESAFGSVAKSYGQSQDWTPAAQAKARTALSRASSAILTSDQKSRISSSARDFKLLPSGGSDQEEGGKNASIIQKIMRTPLGTVFRKPFARRLQRIVLGSPHSNLAAIIDATESLTRLLVASLAEDQFGKVQKDVPRVIKLFTETIMTLDSFVGGGLKPHWSDTDASRAGAVEEVEMVSAALRMGLSELLDAFRLYLAEVGVTGKDLQLAKKAAEVPAI